MPLAFAALSQNISRLEMQHYVIIIIDFNRTWNSPAFGKKSCESMRKLLKKILLEMDAHNFDVSAAENH